MRKFKIDFFELLFLAEACIPERPIARSMFFDDLSDVYYHEFLENERNKMFEFITKNSQFNLENEQCKRFYARFNFKNQFEVQYEYNGEKGYDDFYLFDDRYWSSKQRFIEPNYITKVIRIYDRLEIK